MYFLVLNCKACVLCGRVGGLGGVRGSGTVSTGCSGAVTGSGLEVEVDK